MGLEIDREEFTDEEARIFSRRLGTSLTVLEGLLAEPGFGAGPATLGAELEASLIDASGRPSFQNAAVLEESLDPRLTVELDRFNLESNLRFGPLAGRPFQALADEMSDAVREMTRAAARLDTRVALVGILPTLVETDLQSEAMTDSMRYRALSSSLRRLRHEPFRLDIHGDDALELRVQDVTFEGAATSLQIHLRIPPNDFARFYNAIQLTTPCVLALSGNSPTFLGRRLWEETRVALFKQAVDTRSPAQKDERPARVSFGNDWIAGPLELFREAVDDHPILLPVMDPENPAALAGDGGVPALRELRLHQGTVWSWNRAIYDPAGGGHLRIELRALPSGPTVHDMVANTALHLGLAFDLANELGEARPDASFADVHRDFYLAARHGLDAELLQPSWNVESARDPVAVFGEKLLSRAQAGLDAAGVERSDAAPHLATIERRLRKGVTGSSWQRHALGVAERKRPRAEALHAMFEGYLARGAEGGAVADWPEFRE